MPRIIMQKRVLFCFLVNVWSSVYAADPPAGKPIVMPGPGQSPALELSTDRATLNQLQRNTKEIEAGFQRLKQLVATRERLLEQLRQQLATFDAAVLCATLESIRHTIRELQSTTLTADDAKTLAAYVLMEKQFSAEKTENQVLCRS